ncbi:GNAT family N-acetyltransferase [Peloplasma aerotolerans]|uniref:GNAT family N-acetyltransferase n=1 Tax=Peloplasma aerotolerans TaxID=3044389 RepID=A0AAW6U8P0_9MOLU|nr:GNAT family N-acetyltransferase [Mariniplasma sp. M4Ah]MDI6453095.1 GNAT family N-acetyltransferase [Mariniplasma sp. M4Ah]
MIEIRNLTEKDMPEVVRLKISSWQEELAGKLEHQLIFEEELSFWVHWMHHAKENNDVRTLIGAFEHNEMLGVAFASFAEEEDGKDAFELNGLWVYPNHRGKKLSILLLKHLIDIYLPLKKTSLVVYNHHYAPSNQYYLYLGGKIFKKDLQIDGKLEVDVFIFDLEQLNQKCVEILSKG